MYPMDVAVSANNLLLVLYHFNSCICILTVDGDYMPIFIILEADRYTLLCLYVP